MAIADARFRVPDEAAEALSLSPQMLGGTSVRINLLVADPDAMVDRTTNAGPSAIPRSGRRGG